MSSQIIPEIQVTGNFWMTHLEYMQMMIMDFRRPAHIIAPAWDAVLATWVVPQSDHRLIIRIYCLDI